MLTVRFRRWYSEGTTGGPEDTRYFRCRGSRPGTVGPGSDRMQVSRTCSHRHVEQLQSRTVGSREEFVCCQHERRAPGSIQYLPVLQVTSKDGGSGGGVDETRSQQHAFKRSCLGFGSELEKKKKNR